MKNSLADKRRERDMLQDDLARAVGVSRQTIIAIERGKYDPRLTLAFRLASAFSCRIEDLFNPVE